MNSTGSLKHEQDSIAALHKHRNHSSVMVKVPDCSANDLGSIPSKVSKFVVNIFFLVWLDENYEENSII